MTCIRMVNPTFTMPFAALDSKWRPDILFIDGLDIHFGSIQTG